jgi:hypothetical protein
MSAVMAGKVKCVQSVERRVRAERVRGVATRINLSDM